MAAEQTEFASNEGLDTASLTDLLGYHVRLANVTMLRDFTEALSELDLTQKQCATMRLIATNKGTSQIDLASALSTDRSTMMAIVDRLELRGFVIRKRSTADRRRQELHLTPEGEAVLESSSKLINKHESKFTERFTPEELTALIQALTRIHK